MKPRIRSNSAAIVAAMIERGLSIGEAAKDAGIDRSNFSPLLKADRPIHFKTAAKLRKTFGAGAVTITPAAQA